MLRPCEPGISEQFFFETEKQYSEWNFKVANTQVLYQQFEEAELLCKEILENEEEIKGQVGHMNPLLRLH